MNSEQLENIMGITDGVTLVVNQFTDYSQSYTLSLCEWFQYSYYLGAGAGIQAARLSVPENRTLKSLNTKNATLIYAYENGYTFARIIANAIIAGETITPSNALLRLRGHCKQMFMDRFPHEFWV